MKIAGDGFVDGKISGGAEVEDAELLLEAVAVGAKFVLVVALRLRLTDLPMSSSIDISSFLDLKTVIFNVILSASEVQLGKYRAFQHDDKCLSVFDCVYIFEARGLFCRVASCSENVRAALLS